MDAVGLEYRAASSGRGVRSSGPRGLHVLLFQLGDVRQQLLFDEEKGISPIFKPFVRFSSVARESGRSILVLKQAIAVRLFGSPPRRGEGRASPSKQGLHR
jgi:hypothetical protein